MEMKSRKRVFKYQQHSLVVDPILTVFVNGHARGYRVAKKKLMELTIKMLGDRVEHMDSMKNYLRSLKIVEI